MNPPRVLLVAVVALGLLVPLGPASGAASGAAATLAPAASRSDTRVTVHPFYHQQKYGNVFRLSGQVRYSVGRDVYAAAGVAVTLLRRAAAARRWNALSTDRTSHTDKPRYAFLVRARSNATYRVRFSGTQRLQPSRARTRVWVHRKVASRMLEPSSGDLQLVGRVNPGWRHRGVLLQKRGCRACSWHVVRRQRTNAESRFRFGVGAPRTGSWFFRVQVPRSTGYAPSVSATYRTFS